MSYGREIEGERADARWARWALFNGFDAATDPFYFGWSNGVIDFNGLFDHGFTARREADGLKCLVGDPYGDIKRTELEEWKAGGFGVFIIRPGFWFPPHTTAYVFVCLDPWLGFDFLTRRYIKDLVTCSYWPGGWCHARSLAPILGVKGATLAEFRKRFKREETQRIQAALTPSTAAASRRAGAEM